jgi:quercetin dioxygenase-like cupin family protein
MDLVNAIAKVRFGSAKPQRIQLAKAGGCLAQMLCMEPRQQVTVRKGQWMYYVVTGSAEMTVDGQATRVETGQLVASAPGEVHTVSATGDHRMVCVVFGHAS